MLIFNYTWNTYIFRCRLFICFFCIPRFFDVGIAEGHAVTFAAGLSAGGRIPVFAVYSSFFQRSFDNFIHDAALQNLHCIFAIDRAGLSPDDGSTHHGIFDVPMFSLLDNITVFSPLTYKSLSDSFSAAVNAKEGIWVMRYPKGCENTEGLLLQEQFVYTDKNYSKDSEIVIVTYGRIFSEALKAADIVISGGKKCGVLVLEKIVPYRDSYETIKKYCALASKIVILEEGMESGSFGQNIMSHINADSNFNVNVSHLAIRGRVPGHARLETLYSECGISAKEASEEALK